MIFLLLSLTLCGVPIALALCQAAANGDRIQSSLVTDDHSARSASATVPTFGAFGHDYAEPQPRPSLNRRADRLGELLALSECVWRVA